MKDTHRLISISIYTRHTQAMISFYSEAFGMHFQAFIAGPIESFFADWQGLTIKFIPTPQASRGTPSPLQLGLNVDDIDRVLELAVKYGGTLQGAVNHTASGLHAAVNDPDGNTLELYAAEQE